MKHGTHKISHTQTNKHSHTDRHFERKDATDRNQTPQPHLQSLLLKYESSP